MGHPIFFSLKANKVKHKWLIGSQDTILLTSGFKKVWRGRHRVIKDCRHAYTYTHPHILTHLIIFIFAPIKLSGNKYQMIP